MVNKKLKALFLKGCSASGKSTWAAEFIAANPDFVEINRDNIRLSLYGRDRMYQGDEVEVSNTQRAMIQSAFNNGKSVIISDTNLSNRLVNPLVKFVEQFAEVEWKDFTDVPLEVLLERDAKREFPVGEKVIKRQYYKYIMGDEFYREPYLKPQDTTLPDAVIFDVDGTLTIAPNGRSPYDMTKVMQDKPNPYSLNFLDHFCKNEDVRIFIFSGREQKASDDTYSWLVKHCPKVCNAFLDNRLSLHFRPDNLPGVSAEGDDIIKERLFMEHVKDQYHVIAVFDDRLRVCKNVWLKHGLPLFRVGDPEADF